MGNIRDISQCSWIFGECVWGSTCFGSLQVIYFNKCGKFQCIILTFMVVHWSRLVTGSLVKLTTVSFGQSPSASSPSATRPSRLTAYISCARQGPGHFTTEPYWLLFEMAFGDCHLEAVDTLWCISLCF